MRILLQLIIAAAVAGLAGPAWADPAPAGAYSVVARIAGADGGWDYASVDPVRGRLYVARSDAVMAIDLADGAVNNHLATARHAHEVLPIDNGATLVQTDGTSGLVRFIDAASGVVVAEVATGKDPDFAYFDTTTGLIVVMNPGSNGVVLIDPKTRSIVRTISVPGGLESGGGNGHGHAFINLEDANALAEVDLVAGKLVRTIALTGCDGPTGLAMVAGGTRVLSACSNGVVTVVDAVGGRLIQTLPVGKGPDAVMVDAARGLAFVPSGRAGTLTAIAIADPAKFGVAWTIPTQIGARTGALDPRTGRIYLPTATMIPAVAAGARPTARPGSFVVLVVAPGK